MICLHRVVCLALGLCFATAASHYVALGGNPGITLAEGVPPRPPHYTFAADSPVLDKGEIIAPLTDGFTGAAPDLGALENGTPPATYGAR